MTLTLRRLKGGAALLLALLPLALLTASCAKKGYPTGGPKDEAPPKALATRPPNESRHFTEKQFFIEFDEYVVLKNADANVLISPPMAQKPEFATKGKGVLVRLKDTLRAQTTYLFQFKEAIADFTEGNLLPSFEYVFSTGDAMDTLMLAGTVVRARDEKPWGEAIAVSAFREGDTLPAFVTRTNKEGQFAFHYIPAGSYRIVAMEDKNKNWLPDSTEATAWDTSFYTATPSIDSGALIQLRLSAPDLQKQRLLKAEFIDHGRLAISTLLPMEEPILTGDRHTARLNAKGDTLWVWMSDEYCDSASFVLSARGLHDTLRLRYRAPRTAGKKTAPQPAAQPLMRPLCEGKAAFYDSLLVAFTTPIARTAEHTEAEFLRLKDSVLFRLPLQVDSLGLTARVVGKLASGEEYRMRIADSLFFDLYGHPNDTLNIRLTPRDYGLLTLHITNLLPAPLVVELLDKRDTVVQAQPIEGDGTVRFTHLEAGDYRLRAVIDTDSNGRFTTGDYRIRRQPEEFILYEKTLQMREKWEIEETWTVGQRKRKIIAPIHPSIDSGSAAPQPSPSSPASKP